MDYSVIGFVAFREGSKRLPLKNGRCIGGHSLYQITIEKLVSLKNKGLLSAVVASTDSVEWQNQCRQIWGDAVVIHQRSAAISGDRVNEGEVILDFFQGHPSYEQAAVLLTLCTYPFLKEEVLENMLLHYQQRPGNVFAVKEAHHMPQKLLRINSDGFIRPYHGDTMQGFEVNTKLLKEHHPVSYYSTGAFLIHQAQRSLSHSFNLWNNDHITGVEDDSIHVDIDTEEDFLLAEMIWQLKENQKKE